MGWVIWSEGKVSWMYWIYGSDWGRGFIGRRLFYKWDFECMYSVNRLNKCILIILLCRFPHFSLKGILLTAIPPTSPPSVSSSAEFSARAYWSIHSKTPFWMEFSLISPWSINRIILSHPTSTSHQAYPIPSQLWLFKKLHNGAMQKCLQQWTQTKLQNGRK